MIDKALGSFRSLSHDGEVGKKPTVEALWKPGDFEGILAKQAQETATKMDVVRALQQSARMLESDEGSLEEDDFMMYRVKQTALDPLTDLLKGFLDEGHTTRRNPKADQNPLAELVENQNEDEKLAVEQEDQELDRSADMEDPKGSITFAQARNWRMKADQLISMVEVKRGTIEQKLNNLVSKLRSSLDNTAFITAQIERKYQRRLLGKFSTKASLT